MESSRRSGKFLFPSVNIARICEENISSRDPAQPIRELVSNSEDARASLFLFTVIFGLNSSVGYIAADNGDGMSRPVTFDKEARTSYDSKGKKPGLNAFVDFGHSTKAEDDPSMIGHKGLGCKLLFAAHGYLLVITRQEGDPDWAILDIIHPRNAIEQYHFTGKEYIQMSSEDEVLSFIEKGPERHPELGLKNWLPKTSNKGRQVAVTEQIIKPWLRQKKGTFILVLGVSNPTFCELLREFDLAVGDEDCPGFKRMKQMNRAQGDDLVELKTYLRWMTKVADPFVREALMAGDFAEEQIEELPPCFQRNEEGIVTIKYLTKGNPDILKNEKDRFRLKELRKGWPYIHKVVDKGSKNRDPLTVPDWRNCVTQFQYVKAIDVEDQLYAVVLTIDGNMLRWRHHTMLNRKGGKDQARSKHLKLSIANTSGVLIFVNGVYVCHYPKLLDTETLSRYQCLNKSPFNNMFTLILDGSFSLNQERTGVTNVAEKTLKSETFLKEVKKVLEAAEGAEGDRTYFHKLLIRAKKELVNKQINQNEESMRTYFTQDLQQLPRVVVKYFPGASLPGIGRQEQQQLVFMVPGLGEDTALSTLYSYMRGVLMGLDYFGSFCAVDLERFWPVVLNYTCKPDIGAIGMVPQHMRDEADPRHPNGFPHDRLQNIVFKHTLNIGEDADCIPNLHVTDYIITWDLELNGQPLGEEQFEDKEVNDGKRMGLATTEFIPPSLKGSAYSITNIRDGSGGLVQQEGWRSGHTEVLVVSLPGLIKATFDPENQGLYQQLTFTHPDGGKASRKKRRTSDNKVFQMPQNVEAHGKQTAQACFQRSGRTMAEHAGTQEAGPSGVCDESPPSDPKGKGKGPVKSSKRLVRSAAYQGSYDLDTDSEEDKASTRHLPKSAKRGRTCQRK